MSITPVLGEVNLRSALAFKSEFATLRVVIDLELSILIT
jgi:hypothetical protein